MYKTTYLIAYLTILFCAFLAVSAFSQSVWKNENIKWLAFQWNDPEQKDAIFFKIAAGYLGLQLQLAA